MPTRRASLRRLRLIAAAGFVGLVLGDVRGFAASIDAASIGFSVPVDGQATNPLILDEAWVVFLDHESRFGALFRPHAGDDPLVSLSDPSSIQVFSTNAPPGFSPWEDVSDADLAELIRLAPTADLWMEQARRFYRKGDLDAAFENADLAVAADPDDMDKLEYYSGLLVLSGRYDQAKDLLERLLKEDPLNRLLRFNLACAHARTGHLDDCLRELRWLGRIGWDNLIFYLDDPDLDPVRTHPEFVALANDLIARRGADWVGEP